MLLRLHKQTIAKTTKTTTTVEMLLNPLANPPPSAGSRVLHPSESNESNRPTPRKKATLLPMPREHGR
jgi:hypothetical protein